jgi:hypothetical protein
MAADWLKYGRALETPLPGAITVVYKKPKTRADRKTTSSGYHVAFFDPLGRLQVAVTDESLQGDEHFAPDVGFRCVTATAAREP